MLLVPAFLLRAGGSEERSSAVFDVSPSPAVTSLAPSAPGSTWLAPSRIVSEAGSAPAPATTAAPAPTTTTAAATASARPASTTTTTEAAPGTTVAPASATTTVAPSTSTTTTTALAVTLPAVLTPIAPAQRHGSIRERGQASWFNTADGGCAHRVAPFGTVIRVTRHYNGAVTTCTVNDWGPADTTRVIDLSMDTFAKLAAPEAGLIEVTIEW